MRPTLDEYFTKITYVVAEHSTCVRHKIGAIAVRDKRILVTGYNGASTGLPDCIALGCLRDEKNIASGVQQEVCRAVHAEQNVIIQAALHGISLEGSTVYCTHSPCRICAKMLVNAKIKGFIYTETYVDESFEDVFSVAGIKCGVPLN